MGGFVSTTYHDSIQSVTELRNTLLSNNLYKFSDKKVVIATYYNIDKDYSSLDPGSKIAMDYKDANSPIRRNRIFDVMLYAFPKIELNTEYDEFGLNASPIEGETYILPNTFVPYEGDYFEVEHITDGSWMFIVKDVQKDTMENGANMYKISFVLDAIDRRQITDHIYHNYRYIENRRGTNLATVVRCEDYDIANTMDKVAVTLKKYFCDLFYSTKVQTFIYEQLTEYRIYDPFMIEFMIRNKILDDAGLNYFHVMHQIPVSKTMHLDYDNTFFRAFEECDIDKLTKCQRRTDADEINIYGSVFAGRYENYYACTYKVYGNYGIECITEDLIHDVQDCKIYEVDEDPKNSSLWKNIIVKYFNDKMVTEDEINDILNRRYDDSTEVFYFIPLMIFCLERFIEKVLKGY